MFKNKVLKIVAIISLCIAFTIGLNYVLQRFVAHKNGQFTPNYEKVELTETSDYETIFLQTGLGKPAAEKLINNGQFSEILKAQEQFFEKTKTECSSLVGWFVREDRLVDDSVPLYDLQRGDILVTLSTHSLGWRHGHAAVVLSKFDTIESIMIGVPSEKSNLSYWCGYTNFAVLRVKDVDASIAQKVGDYAEENLLNKRYSLLSGFGLKKAPESNSPLFSLHCSYLAWYAWNAFDIDLDSDGGRLVTSYDILHSDKVEIVQLYGIDPNEFIKK